MFLRSLATSERGDEAAMRAVQSRMQKQRRMQKSRRESRNVSREKPGEFSAIERRKKQLAGERAALWRARRDECA